MMMVAVMYTLEFYDAFRYEIIINWSLGTKDRISDRGEEDRRSEMCNA